MLPLEAPAGRNVAHRRGQTALGGLVALALLAVLLALGAAVLLLAPGPAAAAEVLQVRSATLLQVGDRNRSYPVELACIAVAPEHQAEAIAWLRRELPRRTAVNLRPLGQDRGVLLARVSRLDGRPDLAAGLIAADLAQLDDAQGCA